MYKYDIRFPTEDQLTLEYRLSENDFWMPINVSKKRSYLIKKMRAFRDLAFEHQKDKPNVEYRIVDKEKNVLFQYKYQIGERGNASDSYYHTKEPEFNYIRKGRFNLIADNDGNVLTNEELLDYLYDLRFYIHVPVMITDEALVSMATFLPKNKEDFVALKGLGEKTYDKAGEIFIRAIQHFLEKEIIE